MASPIEYIIHPDPPQPQYRMSGTHNSLTITSGPVSASPSMSRPGPEHRTQQTDSEHQNQTQALYQCADCLRKKYALKYQSTLSRETADSILQAATLAPSICRYIIIPCR